MKKASEGYEIARYSPDKEPFYIDVSGESNLFRAAHAEKIPVLLKGPTGCGKTRFVQKMAYNLGREIIHVKKKGLDDSISGNSRMPLVTVPCHEDLTSDDLKGRFLLSGAYQDGPALTAVKNGGILYLDEVVEARNDTTVVIHPLADDRRTLFVEKLGKVFQAPDSFMLVLSYNPGYQKKIKDLKQSTRQRFAAINFTYPPKDLEQQIVSHEAQIEEKTAEYLVQIGQQVRNLKGKGLDEGASTRLLINAGKLIRQGIAPLTACDIAILNPLTDDLDIFSDLRAGLKDLFKLYFPKK